MLQATNVRARIQEEYPPTVLHHGLADVTVPPENSLKTLEVLRSAKVPSELHTYAGVPHVFDEHPEFAEMAAQRATASVLRFNAVGGRCGPQCALGRRPHGFDNCGGTVRVERGGEAAAG